MSNTLVRKILEHPDLQIHLVRDDKSGSEFYEGFSPKYEPYSAVATTLFDCLFRFNIQLSEQKLLTACME